MKRFSIALYVCVLYWLCWQMISYQSLVWTQLCLPCDWRAVEALQVRCCAASEDSRLLMGCTACPGDPRTSSWRDTGAISHWAARTATWCWGRPSRASAEPARDSQPDGEKKHDLWWRTVFLSELQHARTHTPVPHHKLKIHRAADVLQTGHGTLSLHRPAEEQLVRTSKPAAKAGWHQWAAQLHTRSHSFKQLCEYSSCAS